mgnify:CR=1 FL=1
MTEPTLEELSAEVETLRKFDPATQRTLGNADGFTLLPVSEVLLDMGGDVPGLAFCDIDLMRVIDVRAQVPALANRRPIATS